MKIIQMVSMPYTHINPELMVLTEDGSVYVGREVSDGVWEWYGRLPDIPNNVPDLDGYSG